MSKIHPDLQERHELETQRQAKELSRLSLDRQTGSQVAGSSKAGKVALDARVRPPAQSADELDGHITDGSE